MATKNYFARFPAEQTCRSADLDVQVQTNYSKPCQVLCNFAGWIPDYILLIRIKCYAPDRLEEHRQTV